LKLSRRVLLKLKEICKADASILQRKPSRGMRFKKIHDRAAELLDISLRSSDHPLYLREIQADLAKKSGVRVSRS
jgi:hypothetical protein